MAVTPGGDGIDITVSASGAERTKSKLESLADKARSLVPDMLAASRAMDSAGDEAGDAGRKAGIAAASFATLSATTDGLTASVTLLTPSLFGLATAITAVTVAAAPLIATFSALAVGAAGIVAAFGAIIGTGLIAWNSKLTKQNKERLKQVRKKIRHLERVEDRVGSLTKAQRKQLRQLKKTEQKLQQATKGFGALALKLKQVGKEIAPLIVQFGSQFIPLLKAAVNALPQLVRSIIQAIGPLTMFKNALRDLGEFAMVALPKVIRFVINLGRWALPIFRRIANFIVSNVVPAFVRFIRAGQRLTPTFAKIAGATTRLLGKLRPLFNAAFRLGASFWKLIPNAIRLAKILGKRLAMAATNLVTSFRSIKKEARKLIPPLDRLKKILGGAGLAGAALALAAVFRGPLMVALRPIARILGGVLLSAASSLASVLAGTLIGSLVSLGSTLISLLPTLGLVSTALGTILSPILLITAAVAALYLAWKTNFLNIRNITRKIFGAIKALIAGNIKKAKKRFMQALGLMNKSWSKNIVPLLNDARRVFGTIKRVIAGAMRWLMTNAVRPVLRSLQQLWQRHGQNIINSVKQLFNFLKRVFKVAVGILIKTWQLFGNEILAVTKFVFDLVGSTIKAALDTILTIFDVITDLMAGKWKSALNKLWRLAKRIFGGIVDFIIKWGSGFVQWIIDILADALDAFIQWGKDLIFGSVVTRILNAIIRAIKKWSLVDEIFSVLSDALDTFVQWGKDILGAVKSAFGDVIHYIKTGLWSDLTNALSNLADAAWGAFKNGFNALMPDAISIPKVTVGGYDLPGPLPHVPSATIGGGSIDLPELAVGGTITDTGLFVGHPGETIVPAGVDTPYTGGEGGGVDAKAIAAALRDVLAGAAIELETDDEAMAETARLVFERQQNKQDRAIDRARSSFGDIS